MGGSVDSGDTSRTGEEARPDVPPPGLYRHHKGADYRVIGCVRHSETEERLVLYRPLYGDGGLWVRPLEMFVDTVEKAEGAVPRFALVRADDRVP